MRGVPRHRRAPALRQARRHPRAARSRASRCGSRRSPAPSRSSSAPRRPSSRRAACARPSRSWRSSIRSGYTTLVTWPNRGGGERAAYNLARVKARWDGTEPGLVFQEANLRDGFVAPGAEARGDPRAPADPPAQGGRASGARRARPAAQLRRPAHRRLHRPRGPRRRALRRLRHQDRRRHHARLPRTSSSRATTRSSCRSTSWRRSPATSAPTATQPTLSKLGGTRWDRIKARARRAAQELAGELLNLYAERKRRARLRVRARHRLAARVRGRVPVPRDARPARGDRGGQGRHGVRAPDGPADLRRRRLRQDRGRAARRVQGRQRRQAGADARADDDPRPAALRHLLRAPARLPVHDRAGQPLPPGGGAARRGQALRRGQGRHPDRHAPPAQPRRPRQGPRPDHRRRGAALRRQAEGAAAPAQAQGRRDQHERDADPAHAADEPRRAARHQRDRDAARGSPAGQDVRRRVRRGPGQAGARARARARRPGVLPAQPRRGHRRDRRAAARAVPGSCASPSRTARWTRSSSSSG